MAKSIIIKLENKVAQRKDKKKEIIDERDPVSGELRYIRNDIVGLMSILNRFDTRIHPLKEWKSQMQLKEKLTDCYLHDIKELDLSLDQAAFLKVFLKEFPEREGKEKSLSDFELQTLFGIQDQLF